MKRLAAVWGTVWDRLRPQPDGRRVGLSPRTNGSSQSRNLRVESLEERTLLSIGPHFPQCVHRDHHFQPRLEAPLPTHLDRFFTTPMRWAGPMRPHQDTSVPDRPIDNTNHIVVDASMAAPLRQSGNQDIPLAEDTESTTVVYSKMGDNISYRTLSGTTVGYEDYDTTYDADLQLYSMRFRGGASTSNAVLWFDFYTDHEMASLVTSFSCTFATAGYFNWTIPLDGDGITIPDSGVLVVSAAAGVTARWYGGNTSPTVGTNESSFGSFAPKNFDLEFTAADAIPTNANLTPYQPSGWDDILVLSNIAGTSTTDALDTTDEIFVDWAVANMGSGAASSTFYCTLYLDDSTVAVWQTVSLSAGYYVFDQDFSLGVLKEGTHTLTLVADSTNTIGETNETDNEYTVEFTVSLVNTAPVLRGLPDVTLDQGMSQSTAAVQSVLSPVVSPSLAATFTPLGFDGDLTAARTALTTEPLPVGQAVADDLDLQATAGTTADDTNYLAFNDWGGTWLDAEKDSGAGDNLMCWAAAASNGLVWAKWGLLDGMTDSDAIFQYFQDHWTDAGSLTYIGWQWWFDGTNEMDGQSGWSQVEVAGGAFYTSVSTDTVIRTRGQGDEAEANAMIDVDQYLHDGDAVALGLLGTIGHAVTCWGFTCDTSLSPNDPNYYTGVWITDSDNNKDLGPSVTAPDTLNYYAIAWDAANGRYNIDSYYPGAYIAEVDGLATQPADEGDLWSYVRDGESATADLTFTIVGNTDPGCGATIVDNRYLQINPTAGWSGESDVTIQVADPSGAYTTDTFHVTVPDTTPPAVESVMVNDGSDQRSRVESVTVAFSEEVTIDPGAFELTKTDAGGAAVAFSVATTLVGSQTVATLSFTGDLTEFGSLIDGDYQLRIVGDSISDGAGLHLASDYTDAFFRMFGDTDGDGLVNTTDLDVLKTTFFNPANYLAYLDFDADGDVDGLDTLQFKLRYTA